jgi:hypothetical protein
MTQKERFPDVHIYPMTLFYPVYWHGIKDPELHKKVQIPGESMLFQYGYSTNGFAEIFKARAAAGAARGGARRRGHRRTRRRRGGAARKKSRRRH